MWTRCGSRGYSSSERPTRADPGGVEKGCALNDVVSTLSRWLVRALLVAVGLVFFLSLLAAAAVLAALWGLRALWARLTGRPVMPWRMRVDPRTGWSAVYRSSERWSAAPARESDAPSRRGGVLPGAAEVTDVQPREVRD